MHTRLACAEGVHLVIGLVATVTIACSAELGEPNGRQINASGGSAGAGGTGTAGVGGTTTTGGTTSTGGTATGGTATGGTGAVGGSAGTGGQPPMPPPPGPIDVTPVTFESGPPTWKYGATAAYTIIHDDTCSSTMMSHYQLAAVELEQRGLKAGFGAISGFCQGDQQLTQYIDESPESLVPQWSNIQVLVENGQEIVNHTWSHVLDQEPNGMPFVDAARWQMEIDRARQQLEAGLGVDVDYFIFPYDEKTDEQLSYLATQGYAGARGGDRDENDGVNPHDFSDPFRVDFAVYRGEGEGASLNAVIDGAISWGGWGLREIHAVSDTGDGWMPVPIASYEAHLDYAKQKVDAGELWMDGPARVTKYRFAREACPTPTISARTLSFGTLSADCTKYATELTYVIQTNGAATELVAIQGLEYIETTALGSGRFQVHVNPAKGQVDLSGR